MIPHTDRLELFERWKPLAYRIVGRLLADEDRREACRRRGHDRDDVKQVALQYLWRATGRFDPDRGIEFSTYGGKSAARAVWDLMRPRERVAEDLGEQTANVVDSKAPEPADAVHVVLLGRRVRVEMERLSPELRQLLERVVIGGESCQAVADGCSKQNISQKVHRGLRLMRKALQRPELATAEGYAVEPEPSTAEPLCVVPMVATDTVQPEPSTAETRPVETPPTPAQLFEQNQPLAFNVMCRVLKHPGRRIALAARGHTEDDCRQVALMALHRAALAFDPARSCKFSTLAFRSVWYALLTLAGRGAAFLTGAGDGVADSKGNDHAEASDRQDLEAAMRALPPKYQFVIRRRLAGEKLPEIGQALGISRCMAAVYLNAAKHKLARRLAA